MTQHTGPLPAGFDERTSIRIFKEPEAIQAKIIISHPAFPPMYWDLERKDWLSVI